MLKNNAGNEPLIPKNRDRTIINSKHKKFVKIKEFFRNNDIIKATDIKAIERI